MISVLFKQLGKTAALPGGKVAGKKGLKVCKGGHRGRERQGTNGLSLQRM